VLYVIILLTITERESEIRLACYCVAVGPQFPANHSREAFTWAGVSRNISCSPLAEPLATIEWTRFGQKIVNNDTYRIINTANASYLQVPLLDVVIFCAVVELNAILSL